jgi:hypothetical protein
MSSDFLIYAIAILVVMGICVLAMAVGLIFRNKTFTSCGCASISYRGEKISCAACPDKDKPTCEKRKNA